MAPARLRIVEVRFLDTEKLAAVAAKAVWTLFRADVDYGSSKREES